MIKYSLTLFVIIPFLGFLVNTLIPKRFEHAISQTALFTNGLQQVLALIFVTVWVINGADTLNIKEITIYSSDSYDLFIDLYFDVTTATFLLVGSFLTFLITIYSRYYLHREDGYKRFFNTILFFYWGYNIIIFAGNFETLFIGWEILGISSFLLIAFYRERYLPVRNAFKVFSIYRLGDIAIILAMWMSHHLWHHNISFEELNNTQQVGIEISQHFSAALFISLMILLASAVKSAQLPFSSWLPRAMEGPTPSSAIFYSSLSVHIGVFFLLRTSAFWEHQEVFRWLMGSLGLFTSIVATLTGRVQSTVKSQIAYSSITQIGLIFIEIALGFKVLALIHFASNAFLRTYQLLVSPSVVTYLIKEQQYGKQKRASQDVSTWLYRFKNTIYVLSMKEWNLDRIMFRYLWYPFKFIGNTTQFLSTPTTLFISLGIYLGGCVLLFTNRAAAFNTYLPVLFALIGLLLVISAFTSRKHAKTNWLLITFNHFWIALAVSFNEQFSWSDTTIYLSGVVLSGLVGWIILLLLGKQESDVSLNDFKGHIYEHKGKAFWFLLACLGLAGFPITTTFLGEDLVFSHISANQWVLTILISLSLIIDGLALIRIYARLFLGPHVKTYHVQAHRAS